MGGKLKGFFLGHFTSITWQEVRWGLNKTIFQDTWDRYHVAGLRCCQCRAIEPGGSPADTRLGKFKEMPKDPIDWEKLGWTCAAEGCGHRLCENCHLVSATGESLMSPGPRPKLVPFSWRAVLVSFHNRAEVGKEDADHHRRRFEAYMTRWGWKMEFDKQERR